MNKIASQQRTCLVKFQPGTAWEKLRWIAVSQVAKKVGLDMARGKEFLLASFALLARAEKFFVHLRVIKS